MQFLCSQVFTNNVKKGIKPSAYIVTHNHQKTVSHKHMCTYI